MVSNSSPVSLLSSPPPQVSEKDAKALQFIEEITKNAATVQDKVLAEIPSQNDQTEYLQRFKLGGATDPKTFKSKIPVIAYEDIKPQIQRIANGDGSGILTAQPVSEFFNSSGTSGGEKQLIPMTDEEWEHRPVLVSLFKSISLWIF